MSKCCLARMRLVLKKHKNLRPRLDVYMILQMFCSRLVWSKKQITHIIKNLLFAGLAFTVCMHLWKS